MCSDKVCGTIPAPHSTSNSTNNSNSTAPTAAAGWGRQRQRQRHYREETDSEMDLWLLVARPRPGPRTGNLLSLLVTPYRKTCDPQDRFYRACEKQNRYLLAEITFNTYSKRIRWQTTNTNLVSGRHPMIQRIIELFTT